MSGERRVGADVVMMSKGNMTEFIDLSVHFLKLLIENIISIMDLEVRLAGGGSDSPGIES